MFWRVLFQMLRGSRGRLAVAFVALIAGAAVISALLNLNFDVGSKLRHEFRTLGANLVIAPLPAQSTSLSAPSEIDSVASVNAAGAALMMEATVVEKLRSIQATDTVAAPFLYIVARVDARPVVVAGTWLDETPKLAPTWSVSGNLISARDDRAHALVGRNVARQFHFAPGSELSLNYSGRSLQLAVAGVLDAGDAEDDQIFVNLPVAQQLANLDGQISLVQVNAGSKNAADVAARLTARLPGYDVRPIRQVAESEGALLARIRLLIFSMVALILVLTAFCVLATMAALAIERRADVGLMKALGGSISRVVGLFLAEVGILGAAGGAIGCVAGLIMSRWMGHRVFDAATSVRWEVVPLTIGLMIIVALAGAAPLRMLGNVKPAVIFRGE